MRECLARIPIEPCLRIHVGNVTLTDLLCIAQRQSNLPRKVVSEVKEHCARRKAISERATPIRGLRGCRGKMEANYQALLTGDVAAFEALIQQLMSADNASRKQAESLLEQLKQHSTDLVVGNLMRLMRQSQNPASRDMGAVMLRKVSIRMLLGLSCFRSKL